jgi:uncharacterized protein YjiS (DUF1127 family)
MTARQAQSAADAAFSPREREAETGGLLGKTQNLASQALKRLSLEVRRQQAIWELEQLDDHALRDIGISRSEIEAQVRGRR